MFEFYKFLEIYTPYILIPISLSGWLLWLIGMIYNLKLYNYLKANKPERLMEWTSGNILFSKFPGGPIRYIFGPQDDEDQNILKIKRKIRKFMKVGISLFVSPPIFFAILFLISGFFVKQ